MPVSTQGALLYGRYRVVKHLGSGGMASVLLCEDERLDRLVAVKRLHADSPEDVERRFAREAKLGASLNHPNLVSVYDTAVDDEGVLIVMEYVPGEPLSKTLRRGALRPRRVAAMVEQLGEALDHAHGQGVVHRDVKPGNVLLREDGVTKLVDLGIATASDDTRITRSGIVLGTAAYMAPEQLDGREAGPPADVYALAAVGFEALAGRRARTGRTPMEIAHSITSAPPPDLGRDWPDAPPAAADVLQRGMARDPEDRPRSAGELARQLARALQERPRTASLHPREPRTAATRPIGGVTGRRRSRGLPLLFAGVLAAVAVAVAVVALGSGGGGDEPSGAGAGGTGQADAQRPGRDRDQDEQQPQQGAAPAQPAPAEPAPAPPEPEPEPAPPTGGEPASGAELNSQGFELLNAGRYAEAVPVLQQAVDSFPEGTSDLEYAYALFNLGKALRLAGRPDEAIPILEQRLEIPNQKGIVKRELALAEQAAGY